jgi:cell division protein FtsB
MRILAGFLVILILVVQYRIWVGENSLAGVWRLERDVEKQQLKNSELEIRNQQLGAEITDLKEGLDAVEARARQDLGMIRSDETLYQFSQK